MNGALRNVVVLMRTVMSSLEWWEDQKKLTIYVHPETVEYIKVWGPDIFSDMEDGEVEGAEDYRALWRWLTE